MTHGSQRARAALAIGFVGALATTGCGGKASKQDCEQMLDKYLDMVMAEEPDADKLPADQKKAVRDMKRAVRKAEPSYQKVFSQCEAEITKKEYRCAMAAGNANVWESCID
jgi:hypothetical protein